MNHETTASRDAARARYLRHRRFVVLSLVVALGIFVLLLFAYVAHEVLFVGNDANYAVPPIYGNARLSPEEYQDVRVSDGNESVLITGGLGFIGSHVVDLLLHRGFKVTIYDDESNGHNHNAYANELVPRDITVVTDFPNYPADAASTATAITSTSTTTNASSSSGKRADDKSLLFTHVVHLAAAISVAESMSDPDKYERVNYGGSRKVFDWIRGYNDAVLSSIGDAEGGGGGGGGVDRRPTAARVIRKVVAASSAAIYGDPDPRLLPLRESAPYGGLSPYADTKYRMEGLMREFVESQSTSGAIALRFFNVYGPRQDPRNPYSGVISLFLEMARGGKDITILGDGMMTRDFVYVKDVARAIVLALLREEGEVNDGGGGKIGKGKSTGGGGKGPTFDVYNVCTGVSITINELAARVKSSMGSLSSIVHADPRDGDIRDSRCDPSGARVGMGFKAAVTQEMGLEKTASWFRSQLAK
ncbi:hypothetical protein ACHAXA_002889 [Cyclostephanos tholiformis]|uniref:NAD-dependent epimerase/dehydratase domain-containing protein n=1 Tax=Cyclostephanos tholiformis TaxID=382380 RepID=A0ABD3SGN5_9STRA